MKYALLVAFGVGMMCLAAYYYWRVPTAAEEAVVRFKVQDATHVTAGGCNLKIITDQETGCQYLQACNSLTAMPHTCAVDRPERKP